MALNINEGTQTTIVTETINASTEMGLVKVDMSAAGTYGVSMFQGTILKVNTLGTLPNLIGGTVDLVSSLANGSIRVTVGTVNAGTINTGTINTGTIDLLKAGTITRVEGGSIVVTGLPNLPGGTLGLITRVGNLGTLEAGTVDVTPAIPVATDYLPVRLTDGADFYTATGGGGGGTTVQFNNGTVDLLKAGTITKLEQGSIQITAGTITTGTINAATINAGTIATLGTMGTLGLVNTLTTVSNLTNGSVNIPAGTLNALGTMGTLGLVNTVTNLTSGSVRMTVGTITTGTLAEVTLVPTVTTVANLTNGSVRITLGTIGAGTINTGTINAGTINTGTINAGTFRQDWRPSQVLISYGTMTAATIGTIVAAPSAGSALYVSALDVVAVTGTAEVVVAFGVPGVGGGLGVLTRGNFIAGGGISKSYPIPNSANNTGTALTWNIVGGSGSVAFNVAYFIAVP